MYIMYTVYMKLTVAEFRTKLRESFDLAKNGPDEIIVERYGEQYKLTWLGGREEPKIEIERVVTPAPTPTPPIEKTIPPELKSKLCKNGHPIPYPRDRCLGKGCKYA
jgi:hypothetical protein